MRNRTINPENRLGRYITKRQYGKRQNEIEESINVPLGSLSKINNGKIHEITLGNLRKIADGLKINIFHLLEMSETITETERDIYYKGTGESKKQIIQNLIDNLSDEDNHEYYDYETLKAMQYHENKAFEKNENNKNNKLY